MSNKNQFESSEFYNRRYGNFLTYLVWPIIFGIIILITFMCFTHKEIVIKVVGVISPEKSLAIIQSPSNNAIKKNNLIEGKTVKKGDLLVQFEDENIKMDKAVNSSKKDQNNEKLNALDIYKQSVSSNQNLFFNNDSYGYSNQFQAYQAQLAELNDTTEQNNADIQNSDEKSARKKSDILRSNKQNRDKIESLKFKTLANINEQISELQYSNIKMDGQIKNIDNEISSQDIVAPSDGLIHVKSNQINTKYLQRGSEIAQIYPKLTKDTRLVAIFYVSTNQVTGLRVNQPIRFRNNQTSIKPLLIKGKVMKIDSAATNTKKGNAYKITATLNPKIQDYEQLRYGLSGNVSIITGKKTWINYLKDKIFKSA